MGYFSCSYHMRKNEHFPNDVTFCLKQLSKKKIPNRFLNIEFSKIPDKI